MTSVKEVWSLRGPVLTVAALLIFLPLVLNDDTASRCAYVVLVMAVLWLTEAIPIPATALLPIFMFPMCGVMPAKDVSKSYISDTNMLFMGGLILAVAVEVWELHRRVAIGVLRIVGADPKFVMLGMLLPTWFLSMWISNTATASMMIPIANAVATQMGQVRKESEKIPTDTETPVHRDSSRPPSYNTASNGSYVYHGDTTDRLQGSQSSELPSEKRTLESGPEPADTTPQASSPADVIPELAGSDDIDHSSGHALFCKGLSLCIAYGCNIGGIATLTGTPPNLVFKGQADDFFNERYKNLSMEQLGSGVTFANWMGMALPMSAITLVLAWFLLMALFLRGNICQKVSKEQKAAVKEVITEEWKQLGPMTLAQVEVLVLFIVLAMLWISRDPKESPGWASLFLKGYVSDTSAVMFIVALLFLLPAEVPRVFCLRTEEYKDAPYYRPLLTWEQVHHKLPWGVIILLGGGFALANACKVSGLSEWLGDQLASLDQFDTWVLNLILCLVVAMVTEVTSNTATSTLLMPIMAQIALKLKVNPLYLMASSAMATSFAFMLPVATPPNAIVFSYGHLRVIDMAGAGFFMNVVAVLCLTLAVNTWGDAIFGFTQLPDIFNPNITASA